MARRNLGEPTVSSPPERCRSELRLKPDLTRTDLEKVPGAGREVSPALQPRLCISDDNWK